MKLFSLQNKTALITGGASGIGAAVAEMFTRAGAKVWIADRDEPNGKAVAAKIGGHFLALDVASKIECSCAAQTVGALGGMVGKELRCWQGGGVCQLQHAGQEADGQ